MPAPLPPPEFSAAAAYPQVSAGRAALAAGDWPALRALLEEQDPHGRTFLVDDVGGTPDAGKFLHDVHTEHPEDPLAGTLLGAYLIGAGWRIRSAKRAQYVSQQQFAQFSDHLCRAEQVLIDVTARHPAEVTAWAQRITSARGLEAGQAEARRRYDRLAAHEPHHLAAQTQLLQQLCPKWGGSWERAHAFVRECVEAVPPGAPNAVLVVEAYLEQALHHGKASVAGEFLRGQRARAEIHDAARRSIWHPEFRHGWDWVSVRSTFALAFALMQEWTPAAQQYAALGNLGSTWMYEHLGDGAKEFQRFRDKAYAKGGRP
ncbi:hypothetical protein ACQPYA_24375 [Micromonospora sp. CA-263727]|uniref:hypothetical protein n=1 Tax=Micromonospora sp. CA-263727 TaxID=3239967 RepID=UPI003D8F1ADA